jgi:hypothetical protein
MMAAASGVLLTGLVLSGCTAAPPDHVPVETASSPPGKDQDAAAFEDLLARYLEVPFNDESETALRTVLTGKAMEDELGDVSGYRDLGQSVAGKNRSYGFVVTSRGQGFMVAKACLDVSGTRVVDASGADITGERAATVSVQLKAIRVDDGSWRISDITNNDEVHACG